MKKLFVLMLVCCGFMADSNDVSAGCTIYLTEYETRADYITYLTDYESHEKNASIIKGCQLTGYESSATYKIYLTGQETRARIIIHRKNFPK